MLWAAPTLRVHDSHDELDEGGVAPRGGVMERTGSVFIFLAQDLWAPLGQVLQEDQVAPLSQLDQAQKAKRHTGWCYTTLGLL